MTEQINDELLNRVGNRVDQLINIDFGNRGVEHLFAAERASAGEPLTLKAAKLLHRLSVDDTVLVTTGSVSRSWINPSIGENDGPAGTAALVRAIAISTRAMVYLVAEETLLPVLGQMLVAAGVTVLSPEQARESHRGGTLIAATLIPFTTESSQARAEAEHLLAEVAPTLLISVERTGRNADGIYCSMRGVDYGQGRARIDFVFDRANELGIPTIAVGDGGNEIGMGNVATTVTQAIPFGDSAAAGGAGIGATTRATVLVTAACSNWGAYGIAAALAVLRGDAKLMHTAAAESLLLQRGVEIGLINSVVGIVDDRVDDIPRETHLAVVTMLAELASRAISGKG